MDLLGNLRIDTKTMSNNVKGTLSFNSLILPWRSPPSAKSITIHSCPFLVSYTSNRKMVDSSYSVSDYKNSIIEFYSDYWLGCTASKFIVDEFKKENPEVFFVSINASKQKDHPFIDKYKLFNTPTYVLINNHGEKIARRVGTFNSSYFKNFLT